VAENSVVFLVELDFINSFFPIGLLQQCPVWTAC